MGQCFLDPGYPGGYQEGPEPLPDLKKSKSVFENSVQVSFWTWEAILGLMGPSFGSPGGQDWPLRLEGVPYVAVAPGPPIYIYIYILKCTYTYIYIYKYVYRLAWTRTYTCAVILLKYLT